MEKRRFNTFSVINNVLLVIVNLRIVKLVFKEPIEILLLLVNVSKVTMII